MTSSDRPGTAVNTQVLGRFGSQAVVRLRAGFERSSHPMLIADDQRRWVTGNTAACELLGITREEIPWRTMDEFTPPRGRSRLGRQWNAFLISGAAEGWYELYVPDRGAIPVEFSAIANVLPSRHLSVFLAPEDTSKEETQSRAAAPAWAPVVAEGSVRSRLTKREREVMTLVAAGGQSPDMASLLYLSPETVKSHVQNAMVKLGAHTRAHAVAIALVTGQIIWSMYESSSPDAEDDQATAE